MTALSGKTLFVFEFLHTAYPSTRAFVQQVSSSPFAVSMPNIEPNQTQSMALDFGNFLPEGVMLVNGPVLNIGTLYGFDPNPGQRFVLGPGIVTIPTALNGTGAINAGIAWQVTQCVPGVMYVVSVSCPRSDGDSVEASTRFMCVNPN